MSRDLELEKQIDAYIKGHLSEEEAEHLWEKLLQRPDYIELLKTELAVKSILEKRSSDAPSNSSQETGVLYTIKKSRAWIAAAAVVALLVISINIFQLNTSTSLHDEVPTHFNLADNLTSAEVFRNQKGSMAPADSLLNRGFEAALSGNISKAVATYDKVIEEYAEEPAATKAHLNKGIINYNTGSFGESIISFQSVINRKPDRETLLEKAYWYMGNAYINLEQLEKGRDAMQKVYSMNGIYRKSSFRLLQKLDYKLGNINEDTFEQRMKDRE